MIEITKKSECCGCHGCSNICPNQCIDMSVDNEGFWYPKVNKDLCIDCNLCKKVCPVIQNIDKKEFNVLAYACKNKNEKIRLRSSSGGIFTNLCEYVINNNGIVFGAAFNNKFEVEHMESSDLEGCEKFRGSKYVQSKILNSYSKVKQYLDEGRIVLFTGTQCQIKGLNLYLRKKYTNLILVDFICHGVPSPLIFELYKQELMHEYNSNIEQIGFREKNKGWKEFSYATKFKNGEIYLKTLNEDVYMKGFLTDLYLRPSCYECKSKNFTSGSDITLADYWGIQNKHPEFDDDKGVSLILINSENGEKIVNNISNNIEKIETDLDYAISCNPSAIRPVKYNTNRDDFFRELETSNLNELIEKYTRISILKRVTRKVKSILSKIKKID